MCFFGKIFSTSLDITWIGFLWKNTLCFFLPLRSDNFKGFWDFFPFWGVHEMFRIDTILTFRPGRGPQPFSVARSFPPRALRLNRSQPWRHMWSEWGLHWAKYAKMLGNSVEICFMLEASSKTEIIVLNIMLFTFCGSFIAAVLCRHYCWTGHCKMTSSRLTKYVCCAIFQESSNWSKTMAVLIDPRQLRWPWSASPGDSSADF